MAQEHNVDVLLCNELGTASHTAKPDLSSYVGDWSCGTGRRAGEGVGAFFGGAWQGCWTLLEEPKAPRESRFYLLERDGQSFLAGAFYAPHVGHGTTHRLSFYRALRITWRRLCAKSPRALRFLSGDSNLPGIMEPSKRTRVERFFEANFLSDMSLANMFVLDVKVYLT